MKRRIFKLALFLLLGAIINVAVAWGCVVWGAPLQIPFGDRRASDKDLEHLLSLGWKPNTYVPTDLWESSAYGFGLRCRLLHELTPPGADSGPMVFYASKQFFSGWPAHSMFGEKWATITFGRKSTWTLSWARSAPHLREDAPDDRLLTLRPLWPGFAINTIFYAAVLWLPFAALGRLRRRRRIKRGLCPACAYDLRGSASPTCPECGKTVKR